jgi:hypothetical protein
MDDAAERYLEELRRNLKPLPEDERSDAVREIESHIAEGQADGRPTASVLAAAFAALAWAGYKLLRGYLQLVLAGYRKLLPFRSVSR